MLFSRVLVPRINLNVVYRLKSVDRNLLVELNRVKPKDLRKFLNEQQTKDFVQLRTSLGGKFQSLQQLHDYAKLQLDFDKFFGDLLALKKPTKEQSSRIQIEPRLTANLASDIHSVCSLDYTSSYINWAIVTTTNQKQHFKVEQWNSFEVNLGKKYHFVKTFNQFSESLSTVPLNDANVLLLEESTYRYPKANLITYIAQLQQIRAILNTLLHCRQVSDRAIYHVSGRDIASHFGLFIGNEQSSAEFFLTNLIFNNTEAKQTVSVDVNHPLKTRYHQAAKGQKEPMARCLLRALAFLQCVNEKKDLSPKPQ